MPQDGLPAIGFNYRYSDDDEMVNRKQSRSYLNEYHYDDDQSALSPSRESAVLSNPLYIVSTFVTESCWSVWL